jgi:hypothetical protein
MMRTRTLALAFTVAGAFQIGHVSMLSAQESVFDRMSIHGYFTQGYAAAHSLPIYGIPTDGTSDYRAAAVQLRYALSDQDNFVFQVSNRRLGTNLLSELEEDLELQWAFYQRRLGKASVRVGKVPLPMGFYNETRNVGTLMPFYRAPSTVYPEGVGTFDGANANYRFMTRGWELETGVNAGAFTSKFAFDDPELGPNLVTSRSDWYYSGTAVLNTPIPGIRMGSSYQRFKEDSFFAPGEKTITTLNTYSLDANYGRFVARSELIDINFGPATSRAYYVQSGALLVPRVSLNTQYERSRFSMDTPFGLWEQTMLEDYGLGINYSVSPNVVLKVEAHDVKGYSFDSGVDMFGPGGKGKYLISSLSVSF